MFGVSLPELLVILAIALIIMGPADLVSLCASAGRKVRQARAAMDSLKRSAEECERSLIDEAGKAAKAPADAASQASKAIGLAAKPGRGR